MAEHKPGRLVLIVLVSIFLVATLAVNAFVSFDMDMIIRLDGYEPENATREEMADPFDDDITPAAWAFGIWGVIYTWQAIMVVYWFTTLCRKTKDGYLYYDPGHNHPAILIFYILNLCGNMAWMLIWELYILPISVSVLASMAFFLYLCIGVSVYCLWKRARELILMGQEKEIWLTIFIVQNGLGVYAAWCTLATLLNFVDTLISDIGVQMQLAGSCVLGIVAFEVILWFVLDNFIFEKYFRYMLTPYAVLVWALVGSYDKNGDLNTRNGIFIAVLLGVASLAAMAKLVLVTIRSIRNPLIKLIEKQPMVSDEEFSGVKI